jgi:hypothetical protein
MMMRTKISLLAILLLSCLSSNATNQDRYYRSVEVKDTGWHTLLLPPDIYLKSKSDLSDLRIYKISDKDSVEIPYLRMSNESSTNVKWNSLKLFNQVKSKSSSLATVELNTENSIELEFNFNNPNFDIEAIIEGSNDGMEWFLVKDSVRLLSLHKEGEHFNYTKCKFDDIAFKFLRITYPNANNLTLNSISQCSKKVDQVRMKRIVLPTTNWEIKDKSTSINFNLAIPEEISGFIPKVVFQGEYERRFTLYAYRDSVLVNKKWILNYFEIYSGVLNSYSDNSIYFTPELIKGLQLKIDNADNIPLKVSNAEALVFPILLKTYFPDLNGRYIISYGDNSLTFPDYDLSAFKDKIPTITDTLSVLSEKTIPFVVKKPLFSLPDNLLWFVLLAIIVLLSFFTFKMIKAKA